MSQTSRSSFTDQAAAWSDAELASALLDGELEGAEDSLGHRLNTPGVRSYFETYAGLSDALHPGGLQPVSSDFQSRVMQSVLREPVHLLPAQQREVRQRRRLVSALAAGLGAVGFVSAAYFVALPELDPALTQMAVQGQSPAPVTSDAVQAVQVQSPWQNPEAQRFMDAHGPLVVKIRLEPGQP